MASISKVQLQTSAALTATTTSDTKSLDQRSKKFIAFQKIAAIGVGTSLVTIIQHSPNKTDWFDVATFTAVTPATLATTGAQQIVEGDFAKANQPLFPNLRAVSTFTGGTTTATATIEMWSDQDKS